MEEALIADLGLPFFAVVGGETTKLAAMKSRLLASGRRGGAGGGGGSKKTKAVPKKRFAVFDALEPRSPAVSRALAEDVVVAVRCRRAEARELWPWFASQCAALVTRGLRVGKDAENALVAVGSLVAASGDVCWCVGGWTDQWDVERAGAALVDEARRRCDDGARDYFVARPSAVFSDDEKRKRLAHLFPSVPGHASMALDEEAAYSASNETSAAKVAAIAHTLAPASVVDATACVGGNTMGLARRFQRVFAVEIDADRVAALKANLRHVGASDPTVARADVRVVHGDCLVVLPGLDLRPPAFVFADPPWGGRHYKGGQTAVDLHGQGDLATFVQACADHPAVEYLALKLPQTFDARAFLDASTIHVRSHEKHDLSNQVQLAVLRFHRGAASSSFSSEPPAAPRLAAAPHRRLERDASSSQNKRRREKEAKTDDAPFPTDLVDMAAAAALAASTTKRTAGKKKKKKKKPRGLQGTSTTTIRPPLC